MSSFHPHIRSRYHQPPPPPQYRPPPPPPAAASYGGYGSSSSSSSGGGGGGGPPPQAAAAGAPASAADEKEWVLTLDQVYRQSPSRGDGLDDATERRYRREGCRLAETLALKLDMGRLAATTALVFFHRFYSRNSFKHHDRYAMGGAAVLLAGKVEERARKLKDVALAFLTLQQGAAAADASSEGFAERLAGARQKLTEAERALLNGLGFDLNVVQPYGAFRGLRDRVVAVNPALCSSAEAKRIKRELAALYKKQREKKRQKEQQQQQEQQQSQPPSRVPSSASLADAALMAEDGEVLLSPTPSTGVTGDEQLPTMQPLDSSAEGEVDEDEEMDDDVFQLGINFMHDSLHTVACLLARVPTLAALGIYMALKLNGAAVPASCASWRHLLGIQDERALYVMAREVMSLYVPQPPPQRVPGEEEAAMAPPRPLPEKQRLRAALDAEEALLEQQRQELAAMAMPLPTGPGPIMRIDPYPQPPHLDNATGRGYQQMSPSYPPPPPGYGPQTQPHHPPHPPLPHGPGPYYQQQPPPPAGGYYPPSPPRRDRRPGLPPPPPPPPPPRSQYGRQPPPQQHWR